MPETNIPEAPAGETVETVNPNTTPNEGQEKETKNYEEMYKNMQTALKQERDQRKETGGRTKTSAAGKWCVMTLHDDSFGGGRQKFTCITCAAQFTACFDLLCTGQ